MVHRFVDGASSVCVDSIAIQCICRHQQPCHTDPLLLSTMLRCVTTEIEIMIMCPSDCIKVLPLQKKPGGMKCKWQCGADGLSVVALAPMNLKGGAGCESVCARPVTGWQGTDYRGYLQVFWLRLAHRLIIAKVMSWAVLDAVVFGLDPVSASCLCYLCSLCLYGASYN